MRCMRETMFVSFSESCQVNLTTPNEVFEVHLGPLAFEGTVGELAAVIWHETSHQVDFGLTGRTSYTNHVAIYENELALEPIFGGFSHSYRLDLQRNLGINRDGAYYEEPESYSLYQNGSWGLLGNCFCAQIGD